MAMTGRRLYKTKLCMLYQRGRCSRQSCNFAHGEAELRRFGGSFDGRRENRNTDLRDKLDRRPSPYRRYSPARDRRGHHSIPNERPISHERGSSLSRSPVRSERRYRRKQRVDVESDVSESFRVSDGPDDIKKSKKASIDNEKHGLEEQLKQIRLDNEILEDHKSQLESYLEEKVNEADKLANHIEDLEAQLKKDQDDCKRLNSRIAKFIQLLNKQIKLQEELKRVESRLQKETDQFCSDILKSGANMEDSSANILESNEINVDNPSNFKSHELQNSISTKRLLDRISVVEEAKKGESRKKQRSSAAKFQLEKFIRSEGPTQYYLKGAEGAIPTRSKVTEDDHRLKHAKIGTSIGGSLDKGKGSEVRNSLPSTGMAAHAGDELALDAIESDERLDALRPPIVFENGDKGNGAKSSYMPPPPPPLISTKGIYKQYEGDDEEVDVEKVDDDMLDIDFNSEVEIEQV